MGEEGAAEPAPMSRPPGGVLSGGPLADLGLSPRHTVVVAVRVDSPADSWWLCARFAARRALTIRLIPERARRSAAVLAAFGSVFDALLAIGVAGPAFPPHPAPRPEAAAGRGGAIRGRDRHPSYPGAPGQRVAIVCSAPGAEARGGGTEPGPVESAAWALLDSVPPSGFLLSSRAAALAAALVPGRYRLEPTGIADPLEPSGAAVFQLHAQPTSLPPFAAAAPERASTGNLAWAIREIHEGSEAVWAARERERRTRIRTLSAPDPRSLTHALSVRALAAAAAGDTVLRLVGGDERPLRAMRAMLCEYAVRAAGPLAERFAPELSAIGRYLPELGGILGMNTRPSTAADPVLATELARFDAIARLLRLVHGAGDSVIVCVVEPAGIDPLSAALLDQFLADCAGVRLLEGVVVAEPAGNPSPTR